MKCCCAHKAKGKNECDIQASSILCTGKQINEHMNQMTCKIAQSVFKSTKNDKRHKSSGWTDSTDNCLGCWKKVNHSRHVRTYVYVRRSSLNMSFIGNIYFLLSHILVTKPQRVPEYGTPKCNSGFGFEIYFLMHLTYREICCVIDVKHDSCLIFANSYP